MLDGFGGVERTRKTQTVWAVGVEPAVSDSHEFAHGGGVRGRVVARKTGAALVWVGNVLGGARGVLLQVQAVFVVEFLSTHVVVWKGVNLDDFEVVAANVASWIVVDHVASLACSQWANFLY
jgi:hypothetical protein